VCRDIPAAPGSERPPGVPALRVDGNAITEVYEIRVVNL
jgi:hypothetical protein